MSPSPHFSFDAESLKKLEDFSKPRTKNKSLTLRLGLELLIATEHPDPSMQAVLKTVIDRYFEVPKSIPYMAFHTFIYMLAVNYGDQSAKAFWGEAAYLSRIDFSHKALKEQIDDEMARIINMKRNVKTTNR